MDLSKKQFIVFYLIACIVGIFVFHWFFTAGMMSVSECLSTDCVYSSTQMLVRDPVNLLIVTLIIIFLASFFASLVWVTGKSCKISRWLFFDNRTAVLCYKFFSWLKILKKRDPQYVYITARIFDVGR